MKVNPFYKQAFINMENVLDFIQTVIGVAHQICLSFQKKMKMNLLNFVKRFLIINSNRGPMSSTKFMIVLN